TDPALLQGYQRAIAMLHPTPYTPDATHPPLAKMAAHQQAAAVTGQQYTPTDIYVTFNDRVNEAGIFQPACNNCGDCVSGCNYGAKNTVLMNYIPDAVNFGAEVFTECAVHHVQARAGGPGWAVYFDADAGRRRYRRTPRQYVTADIVVLAAGTIGSTEILLRSREAGLTTSDRLGEKFTGNADMLGFAYDADVPVHGVGEGRHRPPFEPPVGPCITSMIDLRNRVGVKDSLVIQEGVMPGALTPIMPLTFLAANAVEGNNFGRPIWTRLRRAARQLFSLVQGVRRGPIDRTQTYLVMGTDDDDGKLVLHGDEAHIEWPNIGCRPIFQRNNCDLENTATAIGATYLPNPAWQLLRKELVTVHPLGGCAMADDAAFGVVDHVGTVYSGTRGTEVHKGLHVADGAVIPRPVGINPSLTISAVAERTVALIAQANGWAIDWSVKAAMTPTNEQPKPGLHFTEHMSGSIDHGNGTRSHVEFTVTISTDDLETFVCDPAAPAEIDGTVTAPALSKSPLQVTSGTFHLLVDDPDLFDTKEMRYSMALRSVEGKTFRLEGHKIVHHDATFDMWADTTTLFTTVSEGADPGGAVVGTGVLRITFVDFMRLLRTMKVTGVEHETDRLAYLARFGRMFAGNLFHIYGGVFDERNEFAPKPKYRPTRTLRTPEPELLEIPTSDGVHVRLTRYNGGTKGPVIMAPGFGVSTLSFSTDTVETNLPEYLVANGYDAYLFDYRASPKLPSASTSFTLDDVATRDWPAAIAAVRERSGADTVQPLVHCLGSATFLMGTLSGAIDKNHVKSAICSQLTAHPRTNIENHVKSLIRLGNVLEDLGIHSLTTDVKAKAVDELLDVALHANPIPEDEKCHQPSCRRIFAFFGPSYKHSQLNDATHREIPQMFGVSSVKAFQHIGRMVNAGLIVDHNGGDVYWQPQHLDRLAFPIMFLAGEDNKEFFPETSKITYDLLCEANPANLYSRKEIPGYAHMDCFVGRNAATDVFPYLLAHLEETQ
ncbi:MAG: GMC family oxidoreductase N-terminal domain-containing protein, partial [Actinobacteria bacterium]|nr:GMC family oxidoreductase N-terminal domain-containing protein [Actinomycetota bacterium]